MALKALKLLLLLYTSVQNMFLHSRPGYVYHRYGPVFFWIPAAIIFSWKLINLPWKMWREIVDLANEALTRVLTTRCFRHWHKYSTLKTAWYSAHFLRENSWWWKCSKTYTSMWELVLRWVPQPHQSISQW